MASELELRIIAQIGQAFLQRVKERVPSRTLRNSFEPVVVRPGQALIRNPYYWAKYVHDGRPAMRAQAGKMLLFFRSEADDPRKRTRPPRAAQEPRLDLSKEQFRRLIKSGRLIATKTVARQEGRPFFRQAAEGFGQVAGLIAASVLRVHSRELFARARLGGSITFRV